MKSQRVRVSMDEYLQMQQPFGYKVEYYNGEAVFEPREIAVDAWLKLSPRPVASQWPFVAVDPVHSEAMKAAFYLAFHDTVEFCDWPEQAIRKHAQKNIDDYFAGVRDEPHAVSRMLLKDDCVIALALFLTDRDGHVKLDLLFVLPEFQRLGIAAAIVAIAINELQQQGVTEIFSAYHALNQASQDWHRAFGFEDVYGQYYVRMKYSWYRREIQRLEQLGAAVGEELLRERDYWDGLLEEEWRFGVL